MAPYFKETNKSVPTVFEGNEQTCEGVSFTYKFIREPIKFTGKGASLHFDVNGKYALRLNYCPLCAGLFSSPPVCLTPRIYASCGVGEPMRKMFVGYTTKISVTKDFKLSSKTKLRKVKAKSPCEISVFNYNATEKLEEEVTGALKAVEKDIDREISKVDLKPEMAETWKLLCEPTDLKGYGFLFLNPSKIAMSDIRFEGDTAYFDALLTATPTIYSSVQEIEYTALPPLSTYKKQDGFEITMDISVTYDSLSSILTQNLKDTKIEIKGREIIFGDIEIHGAANHQINIKIDFNGKKKGTLYLTGTPTFSATKQHISFPDLNFDIKTKSALLKSAKWLFDKKITEVIRESAAMDLKPYLNSLKQTLDESLNMEIDKGVYMNGKVNDVFINFIHPLENELFIRVQSKGQLGLRM